MTVESPIGRAVELADSWNLPEGRVLISGTQAIVRLLLNQARMDATSAQKIGMYVSGYPGSPLGVLDVELVKTRRWLDEASIVHEPGLNEDLAATSVWGTQLTHTLPGSTVDGVLGVWYGKAPGLDRSGDAVRYGNHVGAGSSGGLLALLGDDPAAKSSSMPTASEPLFAQFGMPVFYPGSPSEVIELGHQAIQCSRESGLWVGLKIVTAVADAVTTVDLEQVPSHRPIDRTWEGSEFIHHPSSHLAPPECLDMEKSVWGPRMEMARRYAVTNQVNRRTVDSENARLGIVAAGTTYYDMREAMQILGVTDDDLNDRGVRILKLGMIWPLVPDEIRDFTEGLDGLLVVEEKNSFIETGIRDILFNQPIRPTVSGKLDAKGYPLVPSTGIVTVDTAVAVLRRFLDLPETTKKSAGRIELPLVTVDGPSRAPYFCSGCPHNRSTEVPDGALVAGGIGCHAMAMKMDDKGTRLGLTQMGAEGTQFLGQSPFLAQDQNHIFQNIGDGTFAHSGSLAVRAAVAQGVNMTFKLLVNSAVAMTGGQDIRGGLAVPQIIDLLKAEGVKKVIVTTEDPKRYKRVRLDKIACVRHRDDLLKAQSELARVPGVTVLIHDQECAAELRRKRRRGLAPEPAKSVIINERVCEGCGDCGRKSHCMSLTPVDTEFGRKTQIAQDSCNKDFSCLAGDCPSFIEVHTSPKPSGGTAASPVPPAVDTPTLPNLDEVTVRLVGIGGTGVVTVARILSMAAMVDGSRTIGSDQIGLAQKGGPVISDVHIVCKDQKSDRAARPAQGSIDAYLVFDPIAGSTGPNLEMVSPERTVAIVGTSILPTGHSIGKPSAAVPGFDAYRLVIEKRTRAAENVYFDALALSKNLFGSETYAHVMVLGAAWQQGLIPVSLNSFVEAFKLNGKDWEKNEAAFAWGRVAAARPADLPAVGRVIDGRKRASAAARLVADRGFTDHSQLGAKLLRNTAELIDYHNESYAESYLDEVALCYDAERELRNGNAFTEAAADGLFHLMAYKDEYEVARLHLDPEERRKRIAEFGEDAKFYYVLHPPILRVLGYEKKVRFGRWFDVVFRFLRAMRVVRGHWFDPFGWHPVRRAERKVIAHHRDLLAVARSGLTEDYSSCVNQALLPLEILGYEGLKLNGIDHYLKHSKNAHTVLEEARS